MWFKALFSGTTYKLILVVALLASLSWIGLRAYQSVYEAGYNKAVVTHSEELKRAEIALQEEYELKMADLNAKLIDITLKRDKSKQLASQLQEQLNKRPTIEVVREISNINTSCTNLGDDFARLHKSIISSAPEVLKR